MKGGRASDYQRKILMKYIKYLLFILKILAKLVLYIAGAMLWILLTLAEALLPTKTARYIGLTVTGISLIMLAFNIIKIANSTVIISPPLIQTNLLLLLSAAIGGLEFADILSMYCPDPEDGADVIFRTAKSVPLFNVNKTAEKKPQTNKFRNIDNNKRYQETQAQQRKQEQEAKQRYQEYEQRQREETARRQRENNSIVFFVGCKSLDDLKTKYRALCRLYHPDLNGSEATVTMQAINDEYKRMQAKLR